MATGQGRCWSCGDACAAADLVCLDAHLEITLCGPCAVLVTARAGRQTGHLVGGDTTGQSSRQESAAPHGSGIDEQTES